MSQPNESVAASQAFVPEHATLLAALDAAATLTPELGITLLGENPGDPDTRLSYPELVQRIDTLASGLSAIGVAASEPVLLVLPTGFDFLAAFFACQRLRAIPVPAYPPTGLRMDAGLVRLGQIAQRAGIARCLTTKELVPLLSDLTSLAEGLELHLVDEVYARSSGCMVFEAARPEDPAFIQYTSGSTGRPKGVVLTHANLTANVHAIGLALELRPGDKFVNWCPLFHDMGLIGNLLTSICWRLEFVLMSPMAFIRHPARWLHAISDHRGTISTAPNFAYAMAASRITEKRREGLDLSSWRVACNGAEPVNTNTIDAFVRAYEPYGFRRETMFPVYGLAEASLAVAFPRVGEPPRYERVDREALAQGKATASSELSTAASFVGVGRAMPGHRIRVVSESDCQPLPERAIGEIQSQGPSNMQGYFHNAEATEKALSGDWLRTGDLGFLVDDQLFIVGRSKDLIIVRGRNIHPEDIEGTVDEVEGVRTGTAVAFGVYDEQAAEERVVVVTESANLPGVSHDDLMMRVRDAVARAQGVALKAVVLVPRGSLPRTSSGKRQRSLCKQRYLAGELPERETRSSAAIEAR